MSSQDSGNGNMHNIEQEIDRDRSHLNDTLRALEEKFSPGQIFDQVMGYTKRNGGDFSNNLVRTVASNPIPTVLAGISLVWLAASRNQPQEPTWSMEGDDGYPARASYGVDPAYDPNYGSGDSGNSTTGQLKDKTGELKGKAGELKDSARGSANGARQRAQHLSEQGRHSAQHLRERGQQQWQRTSQSAQSFFEENPLAVGAAAMAIGALLGAGLPTTRREREILSEPGEKVTDKAKSLAEDSAATAKQAARSGAEAAKQEVQASKNRSERSPQNESV